MKLSIATAAFVLSTVPVFAPGAGFAQTTGVSNPDQSEIKATPDAPPMERRPLTKPSPATPATQEIAAPATTNTTNSKGEAYGAFVPYHAPGTPAAPVALSKSAFDPDANIVTEVNRTSAAPVNPATYDEGVVISVPEKDGELREGTLLRGRIKHELSTATTAEGTPFSAELTEDVLKDGKVILPTGALLEGKVTQVHSGRRISGSAMMHLEPRSVTLPDGTQYILHAQLIDTSSNKNVRVGSEGTLVRRDHPKETLAVVGGVTGASAVAGAMIGGGVGAVVGAGIGAGAGTIVWLKQDRQATLPQDSLLVFSLTTPMILKPMHVANVGGQ